MHNYRFIVSLHNYVVIFNRFGPYYINFLWTHHIQLSLRYLKNSILVLNIKKKNNY